MKFKRRKNTWLVLIFYPYITNQQWRKIYEFAKKKSKMKAELGKETKKIKNFIAVTSHTRFQINIGGHWRSTLNSQFTQFEKHSEHHRSIRSCSFLFVLSEQSFLQKPAFKSTNISEWQHFHNSSTTDIRTVEHKQHKCSIHGRRWTYTGRSLFNEHSWTIKRNPNLRCWIILIDFIWIDINIAR